MAPRIGRDPTNCPWTLSCSVRVSTRIYHPAGRNTETENKATGKCTVLHLLMQKKQYNRYRWNLLLPRKRKKSTSSSVNSSKICPVGKTGVKVTHREVIAHTPTSCGNVYMTFTHVQQIIPTASTFLPALQTAVGKTFFQKPSQRCQPQ